MKMFGSLIIIMLLAISGALAQTKPLTNDDIISMTKAGFGEETIITAIQNSPSAYDTSVGALLVLKNASVGEKVISAMIQGPTKLKVTSTPEVPQTEDIKKTASVVPSPPKETSLSEEWPAELAGMYREVGIYYKQDGKFMQLYGKPVVGSKTGGFLKSSFTMGLSKVRSKGQVPGKHAQLQVPTRQPAFHFYMPEGQTPDSFVVVRMEDKGNRREFEVGSFGGASGSMSSGLQMSKVSQVIIERVASHVYRVTPDRELDDGEYGFIGTFLALSAGMAGGGEKVYDFGVHLKRK